MSDATPNVPPPKAFAYRWRDAYMSRHGPDWTVRHVLNGLMAFMTPDGDRCFPPITSECDPATGQPKSLSDVTGMGRTALIARLKDAEASGWIFRKNAGHKGQGYRRTVYVPHIPTAVDVALQAEREARLQQVTFLAEGMGRRGRDSQGDTGAGERGSPGDTSSEEDGSRGDTRENERGPPGGPTRSARRTLTIQYLSHHLPRRKKAASRPTTAPTPTAHVIRNR